MIERIIDALGEYLEWITIPPEGIVGVDYGMLIKGEDGDISVVGDVRATWPIETSGCGCCSYPVNAVEYASIPDAIERMKSTIIGGN